MLIAEYYAGTRTAHASLDISWLENGRRTHRHSLPVSGKRDAEAQRKTLHPEAQRWNY